jgi:hypothetical protein
MSGFVFDASMPAALTKELAWASFAVLKNTNACTVAFGCKRRLLLSRGFLGEASVCGGKVTKPTFDAVASSVAHDLQGDRVGCMNAAEMILHSRSEMLDAGLGKVRLVPKGVKSVFVASFSGRMWMMAMFDFEAGLWPKELQWLRCLGSKVVNAHGVSLAEHISNCQGSRNDVASRSL